MTDKVLIGMLVLLLIGACAAEQAEEPEKEQVPPAVEVTPDEAEISEVVDGDLGELETIEAEFDDLKSLDEDLDFG